MLNPKDLIRRLKNTTASYRYNKVKDLGDKVHFGFMAQKLVEEFGEDYAFVRKDPNGEYWMVDPGEFIAPIVSVINDQQDQIDELKRMLQDVQNKTSQRN